MLRYYVKTNNDVVVFRWVLWCNRIVFFFLGVCCRSVAAKHEGREGEKATSIRGLIYSDYKWLPSVGADQRLRPVLRLKSSPKHRAPLLLFSPTWKRVEPTPRRRSLWCCWVILRPRKTAASLLLREINWEWKKNMIMSLSFVSVKVGGFFWFWPHVEPRKQW